VVEIVENDQAKWAWLSDRADEYVAEGKVLIFVLSKTGVEELTNALRK
jgi:superfamily II DNA/RNA helicase